MFHRLITISLVAFITACSASQNTGVYKYSGGFVESSICTDHLIYRVCDSEESDVFQRKAANMASAYAAQGATRGGDLNIVEGAEGKLTKSWQSIVTRMSKDLSRYSRTQVIWIAPGSSSQVIYNALPINVSPEVSPFIYLTGTQSGVVVQYEETARRKFEKYAPMARYLGFDSTQLSRQQIESITFPIYLHLFELFTQELNRRAAQSATVEVYHSSEVTAFVTSAGKLYISSAAIKSMSDTDLNLLMLHEASHLFDHTDETVHFSRLIADRFKQKNYSLSGPLFSQYREQTLGTYVRDNHFMVDALAIRYADLLFGLSLQDYMNFLESFEESGRRGKTDIADRISFMMNCPQFNSSMSVPESLIFGSGGAIIDARSVDAITDAYGYLAARGDERCFQHVLSELANMMPHGAHGASANALEREGMLSIKKQLQRVLKNDGS